MIFSDSALEAHLRGAEAFIQTAFRPGIRANHSTALKLYTEFTSLHNLRYDAPTVSSICAYLHYLTTKYNTPSTILNYFGSLCTLLTRIGADTSPFRSVDVADFIQSIKTNIRHVPDRKLPISYHMLVSVIEALYLDPNGPSVVFAVLIMYFMFLRQSNVAPRNKSAFDCTRHLTRSDIILRTDSIIIAVEWSKARQGTHASSLAAPALPGAVTCPCQAYLRMIRHAPTLHPTQALVSFRDASPLPISYLRKAWADAMNRLGITNNAYTLHSLRRGGATHAFSAGASIQEIRQHGDWRSDAVYAYLPNDPSSSRVVSLFRDNH